MSLLWPVRSFFTVTCWGSGLKVADNNRLNKLIRRAGDVVGEELDTLTTVAEWRMLSKLQSILDDVTHPLYGPVQTTTFFFRKCTCIASFWPTVHTDPKNAAPENALF